MLSGNTGKLLLRLRSLLHGLPRGNNFPYFPENMKYYYSTIAPRKWYMYVRFQDLHLHVHCCTFMVDNVESETRYLMVNLYHKL